MVLKALFKFCTYFKIFIYIYIYIYIHIYIYIYIEREREREQWLKIFKYISSGIKINSIKF